MSDFDTQASIEKALAHIDPHDRDTWVRMGAAIKSELGENGFIAWDNWSRQAKNYKSHDAKDVWRGLKPGMINIGSLFYEARQHGYVADKPYTPPSAAELARRQAERTAAEKKAQQERADAAQTAKEIAQKLWETARPADPNHPYLIAKGISDAAALSAIRQNGSELLIPLRQNKEIVALQRIDEQGVKRFGKGSTVKGSAMIVGGTAIRNGFLMAEGFATAASLHQATRLPVVVTFNAGNLVSVAQTMAQAAKNVPVTICADNDESRTGLNKAIEAARIFGDHAKIALPEFSGADKAAFAQKHGEGKLPSDFNDLTELRGIGAVSQTIAQSMPLSQLAVPHAPRTAWNDFPPVVRNSGLKEMRADESYRAAKQGDQKAAAEMVKHLLGERTIHQLKEIIGGRKVVLLPVHAEESAQRNQIPLMLANALSKELNLEIDNQIVQSDIVSHTGSGINHRLAFPATFTGNVQKGQEYLLVDDTLFVGGTIASLKGYVEHNGGKAIGAVVMAANEESLNIVPEKDTIQQIRIIHGDAMDQMLQKELGYDTEKLTRSEAGHAKSAENADGLRDRILTARFEGRDRVRPSVLQSTSATVTAIGGTVPRYETGSLGDRLLGEAETEVSEQSGIAAHESETTQRSGRSSAGHEGLSGIHGSLATEPPQDIQRTADFITPSELPSQTQPLEANPSRGSSLSGASQMAKPYDPAQYDRETDTMRETLYAALEEKGWHATPASVDPKYSAYLRTEEGVRRVDVHLSDERNISITGEGKAMAFTAADHKTVADQIDDIEQNIHELYSTDKKTAEYMGGHTIAEPQNRIDLDEGRLPARNPLPPPRPQTETQTVTPPPIPDQAASKSADTDKKAPQVDVMEPPKAPPPSIGARYVVADGRYIDADNGATVLFEDKGRRLSTARTDPQTINDMLEVAKAKGWDSIKLSGRQEFKRMAYIHAESQGIRTRGYSPSPEDIAMVTRLREERSLNKIEEQDRSADKAQPKETDKAQPKENARPKEQQHNTDKRPDAAAIAEADRLMARSSMPTDAHINASPKADVDNDISMREIGGNRIPAEVANAADDIKHHAIRRPLSVAKSAYDQKAVKLSRREFAKLKAYERTALDIINRLKPERRDRALANFYEGTARHMHGTRLSFPEPLKVPEQQRAGNIPSPQQDRERDSEPEIDR